jgi:hypothetical protein
MKISEQIADIVYPIDGKSSGRLNADLVRRIEPITAKPIQLLQSLMDCNVPNKSNQHIFDEVNKFLKENK